MSPLEARLRALRDRGQAGLVPFTTAGHLGSESTVAVLAALERGGAAAIEVGIPFSDPLADGPAIQRSSERALGHGITVEHVFDAVSRFRTGSELPVVLMTYVNPVLAFGPARFATAAREAGVSGAILSDLPPEERPDVWQALAGQGLDRILLVAPTSSAERRLELARASTGFVYCLSRTGVTGDRRAFATELETIVGEVRRAVDVPVGVGFGVADAERARQVARLGDAVIVGAALCERLEEAGKRGVEAAARAAEAFVAELALAIGEVRKAEAPGPGTSRARARERESL